jgi:hypothetical protein
MVEHTSEWWNIPTDQACSTEERKESYQLVHQQSCDPQQFTNATEISYQQIRRAVQKKAAIRNNSQTLQK